MTIKDGVPAPRKVTYNDYRHLYHMDGVACKSVSKVAQILTDTYQLDLWAKRTVAIGMTVDHNLVENLAVDIENKTLGNAVAEDAIKAARAHEKANRGTQMHKVLELVLLNQEDRLLTDQQRRDARVLRRTLDRYGLEPYDGMAEQFVAWPHHRVGGRFDCALRRIDNGRVVMTDLKSGPNAIAYPHSTAVQLALYARAPWISDGIEIDGDTTTITSWRKHPEHLDRRTAYVLLVPADAEVGTLHEVDIDYGWEGAQIALQAVMWRKAKGYMGRDCVREVPDSDPPTAVYTYADLAMAATDVEELRDLWRKANADNRIDDGFLRACDIRRNQLEMTA